jgi:competence ComEA-like helix-hairpin-helix protein
MPNAKPSEKLDEKAREKLVRAGKRSRARAQAVALFLLAVLVVAISAQCKKTPPATPIDLNTATAAELAQIPGIGPGTAHSIVQFREKSGPFRRVEDLLAIRGITQRKLNQIKPYAKVASTTK